jgi:hypothetical protein
MFGGEAAAKKAYRAQLRKLARVRMAQRAEMRKVGLPELDQARDLAMNGMDDASTAILECPSVCADAVAAKITRQCVFWTGEDYGAARAEFDRFEGRGVIALDLTGAA